MMAFSISDLSHGQLVALESKQLQSVEKLHSFVERLEVDYFNPADAPSHLVKTLNSFAAKAYELTERFGKFISSSKTLSNFVEKVEAMIEQLVHRFWKWADRRIINSKEAAEQFGKSRSTIYRWIKQGKVQAQKVKGKWQIIG